MKTEQQQVEDAIVATIQESMDSWKKFITKWRKWQKVESLDLDHKLPEGLTIRDWVDQAIDPGDRRRWLTAGAFNPKKCRELEDAGFSPAAVSERIYNGQGRSIDGQKRSIANLYCTEEIDIEMVTKMVSDRQNL